MIFALLAMTVAGGAWATTYYVAPNGSDDTTDGTSEETAFASISAALGKCGDSGDEVVVCNGTYEITERIYLNKGVTVRGKSGNPKDVTIKPQSGLKTSFVNVQLDHADAVVMDMTIADGHQGNSWAGAAGVNISSKGGTLCNCVVVNCKTDYYPTGGGIYISEKSPGLVDRCVISNCTTSIFGGSDNCGGSAIQMRGGTVRNTLMVANTMNGSGAAGGTVRMMAGVLENCTIVGNKGGMCAGVRVSDQSVKVRNCLIVGNTSTGTTVPSEVVFSGTSSCFTNCLADAAINDWCLVEAEPLESLADGLYLPKVGSKAIDAATSEDWMADARDVEGNARVSGAAADIGAYERDSAAAAVSVVPSVTEGIAPLSVTFTVKTQNISGELSYKFDWKDDGTDVTAETSSTVTKSLVAGDYRVRVSVVAGGKTYSTPGCISLKVVPRQLVVNPGESISAAVESAVAGCEIVLKPGTHPNTAAISVEKGVTIRGETGNPEDVILQSDNTDANHKSHRLFYLNHPDAKIAGLAMERAYYKVYGDGGATVKIDRGGGTVSNCVIRGGRIADWNHGGAGIYIVDKSSQALVTHSVISNCAEIGSSNSGYLGGGAAVVMYAGNVRNCLFTKNVRTSAPGDGSCFYGTVRVHGGTLANCTIADNVAGKCAGVWATAGTVVNCLIAGNETTGTVDSYRVYAVEASCFTNCVTDFAVNDWCTVEETPYKDAARGDYSPAPGTASVNTGTTFDWMTGTTDLVGNDRIRGEKPDIGCYEIDPNAYSATFAMSAAYGLGEATVTFTVTPVNGGSLGTKCAWKWGADEAFEGEIETLQTTHTFANLGEHEISVRVTDKADPTKVYTTPSQTFTLYPKTMYVSKTGKAVYPYGSKEDAANDIQTALDVAADGCEIVLVPDTYKISSAILMEKGVHIRGETGNPEDVVIDAQQKCRVFDMNAAGARVSALVVANGCENTQVDSDGAMGGGIRIRTFGGTVSNCVIRGCVKGNWTPGGGIGIRSDATTALVTHCVVSNCQANGSFNSSWLGGGGGLVMFAGTVRNCLFTKNVRTSSTTGGYAGCHYGTVRVAGGTLENCTVAGNTAGSCAGVWSDGGSVVNCLIADNETLIDKVEGYSVWAGDATEFSHCVSDVKINDNDDCKVVAVPFLDAAKGDYHLAAGTDAVNGGAELAWMAGATDLEGNDRIRGEAPDVGCYEADPDAFAATFAMSATKGFKPAAATFTVTSVNASGSGVTCDWDWNGDGTYDETVQGTEASHTFTDYGTYNVRVRVTDKDTSKAPFVTPTQAFSVYPKTLYVSKDGTSTPPYDEAGKAAADIQTALDAAADGCEIVLASGTYALAKSVVVEKDVHLRGATGNPEDVIVDAQNKCRAFDLNAAGAKVSSLVVANGYESTHGTDDAYAFGAGIRIRPNGGTVSNCVVRGCTKTNWNYGGGGIGIAGGATSALVTHCVVSNCSEAGACNGSYLAGGGALVMYAGTVRNCLFTKNVRTSATGDGSCFYGTVRVDGGTLENCTVAGNSAGSCAGVWARGGSIVNCLIADNETTVDTAANLPVWAGDASKFDTCVSDVGITGGVECSTVTKPFANAANGNYRLAVGTAAVDGAKTLDWMEDATDLDMTSRIKGDGDVPQPDVGCYELAPVFAVGSTVDQDKGRGSLAVELTVTVSSAGSEGYDLYVDWGEGEGEVKVASLVNVHAYTTPGGYSISVRAYSKSLARSEASAPIPIVVAPNVIWVRPDGDAARYPYATKATAATNLFDALDLALDGCEVRLVNGTYPILSQLDIGKAIVIQSETGRPEDVVIRHVRDNANYGRVVNLKNSGATVASVTLENGLVNGDHGGGVRITADGGTVSNCVIRNCAVGTTGAWGMTGGGVYVLAPNDGATSLVTHCIITNCYAGTPGSARNDFGNGAAIRADGGAIRNTLIAYNYMSLSEATSVGSTVYLNGSVTMDNCTIVSNRAAYISGVRLADNDPLVRNCIISANYSAYGEESERVFVGSVSSRIKSCVMDVDIGASAAVVEAPELTFRRPARGDWRLRKGSAAIDYGAKYAWMTDGATDLKGQKRILGKKPDAGCYERFDGGLMLIVR